MNFLRKIKQILIKTHLKSRKSERELRVLKIKLEKCVEKNETISRKV